MHPSNRLVSFLIGGSRNIGVHLLGVTVSFGRDVSWPYREQNFRRVGRGYVPAMHGISSEFRKIAQVLGARFPEKKPAGPREGARPAEELFRH